MNFVCDSSSLISLAETCTLPVLAFLRGKKGAEFLVTPSVVYEIVENPAHIKKYAFTALRLKHALRRGTLIQFNAPALEQKAREIMLHANNLFFVNGKALKILHAGEAECLAAYEAVQAKALVVDEKTTRLLIEAPELLLESLNKEYGGSVKVNASASDKLKEKLGGLIVLRSTELLEVAFENGYFADFGGDELDVFHSAAYSLREAGCSITTHELLEYEKISR